jgi:hypothetical protein
MLKKCLLLSVAFLASCAILRSQNTNPTGEPDKNLPTISVGAGIFTFNGDVGKENPVSSLASIRPGYAFQIEQRFAKLLGVSLNAAMGSFAKEQRVADSVGNMNFENRFMKFGLGIAFHFDNDIIMQADYPIAPFIFTGVNYFMGEVFTDKTDANGNPYYYWSDGSIRDLPQISGNEYISNYLKRDYSYETSLNKVTGITVPVGLGIKLKINRNIQTAISSSYNLAFTDELDNVKKDGNDSYFFHHVSIGINLAGSKSKGDKDRYSDVNFDEILKADEDNDGVTDTQDQCPGTPKGVAVNKHGCPPDDDGDGVPNYLDKEPNSKKGVAVDEHGVMLTDAKIAELNRIKDSLANVREKVIMETPTKESLENIDQQIVQQREKNQKELGISSSGQLPAEFKSADTNRDGIISSSEINAVIDAFFDGSTDFTVEKSIV